MSVALSLDKNTMSQAGWNSWFSLFMLTLMPTSAHALTHTRTRAHTHTRTHAHTNTRTCCELIHNLILVKTMPFCFFLWRLKYNVVMTDWYWSERCIYSCGGVFSHFFFFFQMCNNTMNIWLLPIWGRLLSEWLDRFRHTVECCKDDNGNNTLTHCRGIFQTSPSLLLVTIKMYKLHYSYLICIPHLNSNSC